MPIWAYGHMQKNMAKGGIPEKSIKNVAQGCRPLIRRTFQSKVMAKNLFSEKMPCILHLTLKNKGHYF